jgi:hypothetical protein
VKTPRERLNIWKRELKTMEPQTAFQLLLDITEQAIKEAEGGKHGNVQEKE